MSDWTPNEPKLCAVVNLAAILASAAVIDRRRITIPAFGDAIDSEIALPGDADYPLTVADFESTRFFRVMRTSPLDLLDETDRLPAAWVVPDEFASRDRFAAILGGRPAPGRNGDNPVLAQLAIAFKATGDKEPDAMLRFLNRSSDLFQRLEREHASLGVDNLSAAFDEPVPAYSPDGRTIWVVCAAAITHPGERAGMAHTRDALTIWNDDGGLDEASATISAASLTLTSSQLPNPVTEEVIDLDGLSMTAAAQAIESVGSWRATVANPQLADFPARLLIDQERTDLVDAANAKALVIPPLI